MLKLQTTAVEMLDGLSEKHLSDVIDFIRMLKRRDEPPTPEEIARKEKAFQELEAMGPISLPRDYDQNDARMAALREKYGPFD